MKSKDKVSPVKKTGVASRLFSSAQSTENKLMPEGKQSLDDSLTKLYKLTKKNFDEEKKTSETFRSFEKVKEREKTKRHSEFVKVLSNVLKNNKAAAKAAAQEIARLQQELSKSQQGGAGGLPQIPKIPGKGTPQAPKPQAPKAEAPKPQTQAPKPEAPKPQTQAPKPEAPKPQAPKPEAPKTEVPKPQAPKPEAPKPQAPKPEAPKPQAPKPEAPKPEAPKPQTQTPAQTQPVPKQSVPKGEPIPPAPKPSAQPAPKPQAPKPEAPKPKAEPVKKPEAKPPEAKPKVEKVKPATPSGGDASTKKMIMQHEGSVPYPYKDSRGLWTIGVGHLIGDGKTLPPEYAAYRNNGAANDKKNNTTPAHSPEYFDNLFEKDYEKHKQLAMKTPGWDLANETGQAAMIDLTYNMGAWFQKKNQSGQLVWKNTVGALQSGNFDAAADGLKNSAWYTQVKGRGTKIVDMIRNGKKSTEVQANTVPPAQQNASGTRADQASRENKDLKNQPAQNPTVINQQTTVIQKGGDNTTNVHKKSNDKPLYQR